MARLGLKSARVYDPVLRLLHWVSALLIAALLISGLVAWNTDAGEMTAWLHDWHGWLGAALAVGFSARIAWGLAGPDHARFADMWQPEAWRRLLGRGQLFRPPERFGHHPVASLAYLGLYALLAGLILTGLVLLAVMQGQGPLSHWLAWHRAYQAIPLSLHEIASWLVLGFVGMHLAALILHPLRHQVPVAQAMVTGVQYLTDKVQE
jgi:Ni/Fe-hydrogenase 1 B-type cytochrome subunit